MGYKRCSLFLPGTVARESRKDCGVGAEYLIVIKINVYLFVCLFVEGSCISISDSRQIATSSSHAAYVILSLVFFLLFLLMQYLVYSV